MTRLMQRRLQPGERIRVLVVDDSVVIRRLVTHALEEDSALEVVGAAANGVIALQRIPQLNPDVLTLDIEMPEMDGLELLRRVRREYPALRVIMFSTLTERGAAATIEALALGADDYVAKASNQDSLDRSLASLRQELVPRIQQFFHLPAPVPPVNEAPRAIVMPARECKTGFSYAKLVAIGASTGGPAALRTILSEMPADFPLPLLVVQHMPPVFTRLMADRLSAICHLPVFEASQGDRVVPGKVLIAPGDFHMKVAAGGGAPRICLDQGPPLNSCRPSVDALFSSLGEIYGSATLAVILTGMGRDGLHGARILSANGAAILAQDQASSVVWGMPGAVAEAGLAAKVLPLEQIVPEILRRASPN